MKYIILLLFSITVQAEPLKIAVLDSGLIKKHNVTLCEPVIDITGTGSEDFIGHGTNVSSIIEEHNKDRIYCQVVFKIFTARNEPKGMQYSIEAWKQISERDDIKVVNYSAGGDGEHPIERFYIKKFLDKGGILISSAGNEHTKLDFNGNCNYFPACYDPRIMVIGALDKNLKTANFSNRGPAITLYASGEDVKGGGFTLTGTSQATAVATAAFVRNNADVFKIDRRIPQSLESEKQAYEKSAVAAFKQTGMENYVQKIYTNRTPRFFQYFVNKAGPLCEMMYTQKIQYEWTF